MIDKQTQILKFLKDNGRSSTSKIAFAINSNSWMTRKYLNELESKGKVTKEEETNSTYWKLKGGKE